MLILTLAGWLPICSPHSLQVAWQATGQVSIQDGELPQNGQQAFAEFLDRVHAYVNLRDRLRDGIPPVHHKDKPEQIRTHQQLLAERIQKARKDAKESEVFTPGSKNAFRQEIEKVFSGKHARSVKKTLVQGEPVRLDLYINKAYPEKIPITTVPPTLLQHFPTLPKGLEYRVVGSDLILQDVESRLVVDIFRDAFPNAPPG